MKKLDIILIIAAVALALFIGALSMVNQEPTDYQRRVHDTLWNRGPWRGYHISENEAVFIGDGERIHIKATGEIERVETE